jgi:hypothetical protein
MRSKVRISQSQEFVLKQVQPDLLDLLDEIEDLRRKIQSQKPRKAKLSSQKPTDCCIRPRGRCSGE